MGLCLQLFGWRYGVNGQVPVLPTVAQRTTTKLWKSLVCWRNVGFRTANALPSRASGNRCANYDCFILWSSRHSQGKNYAAGHWDMRIKHPIRHSSSSL